MTIPQLTPREAAERLERGDPLVLLDCREEAELQLAALPGAVHIPMRELPGRVAELDPEAEYVVVCHHGFRSARVAGFLLGADFSRVHNLRGGIDAWSREVDPSIPTY